MADVKSMTVADVRRMLRGENVQAASVEPVAPPEQAEPPVTVETVSEEEMQTTETVEIVEADEQTQRAVPRKRKGK